MEARLRSIGEITVVDISGRMDIDVSQPLGQACLQRFKNQRVIFNLKDMSFVGSTGLRDFIKTVQQLESHNPGGVRLVGVSHELQRLLSHFQLSEVACFADEINALSGWINLSLPRATFA